MNSSTWALIRRLLALVGIMFVLGAVQVLLGTGDLSRVLALGVVAAIVSILLVVIALKVRPDWLSRRQQKEWPGRRGWAQIGFVVCVPIAAFNLARLEDRSSIEVVSALFLPTVIFALSIVALRTRGP